MKHSRWLTMTILIMVMSILYPAAAQVIEPGQDDPMAATHILGLLNARRLEVGAPPLKPNDTLKAMAIMQASYLASLPEITGGNSMHIGANGDNVRDRALFPEFNWATYGGQAAVAEVGAASSEEWAMDFWHESDIHRETITNPMMREVGVAAVVHPWGHVYIVVLGSRPDVLPVLVDPRTNMLYLTQDLWKYGAGNAPATQVFLFDADGRPLNGGAGQAWAAAIPMPSGAVGKLYVLYDDGISKSLTAVDLVADQIILPGYVSMMETPIATPEF